MSSEIELTDDELDEWLVINIMDAERTEDGYKWEDDDGTEHQIWGRSGWNPTSNHNQAFECLGEWGKTMKIRGPLGSGKWEVFFNDEASGPISIHNKSLPRAISEAIYRAEEVNE